MSKRSIAHLITVTFIMLLTLPAAVQARYAISCSSNNYRYQYCGANTDGYARLVNQQSRAACVRGRTWGFDNGGVWVNNGCSGQFEIEAARDRVAATPARRSLQASVSRFSVC